MKTEDKLRWIEGRVRDAQAASAGPEPIAIVGLSGMFPQCADVRAFWHALDADEALLEEIPATRFPWRAWHDAMGEDPDKSRSKIGGFLPDIASFDPHFFGILPDDAVRMDPRQRLMLMSVYHTLEDAGIAPSSLKKSRTGVFVAGEDNEYARLLREAGVDLGNGFAQAANMLANQISYFFDFAGPSETINTMCSGGAVALHRAVSALRAGEVEQVVVGAANVILRPEPFVQLSRAKQLSTTETVRSFGEGADGHLRAEGVASVLLKPLRAAEAAGDRIYAVIKHSAVNYNGQGGMSIAAPFARSHQEVIRACYDGVKVDPREVGYIEAQGMGNPVADLAEWHACNNALRAMAEERGVALSEGNCRVSTLKPMIGHMESTSAFGALFKIIRSFQTNTVHKIVGFTKPHPELVVDQQPCRLMAQTEPWPGGRVPRMAGLHAYGIGGNNAHLLVEEYRDVRRLAHDEEPGPELVVLSARAKDRLQAVARQLAAYLDHTRPHLADVAYTLQTGREGMRERVAFMAHSIEELQAKLLAVADGATDEGLIYGSVSPRPGSSGEAAERSIGQTEEWIALGRRWTEGGVIPWEQLRPAGSARRIALPGYPFVQKRCWFEEAHPVEQVCADEAPNKLIELYDSIEERSGNEYWRDYLTFFPFLERVPGFSTSRVAFDPARYPKEMALVSAKKIELRQVLFYKERFEKLGRMLDIGCGHGTDVLRTASVYPDLRTDGFTITPSQAKLGNKRIAELGLGERVRIFHRDSTRDPFPETYDLAIGIEVCCHIGDKEGLFRNLTASLREGSRVLLMDFLTNLRGPIADPKIETYIPTREEWVDLLARHRLVLDEVVDVSPQIANANHDDELEESIKDLPVVLQDAWRNWTHNAAAIERGWVGYFIFRIAYRPSLSERACRAQNMDRLSHAVAYPDALADMLSAGYIPYPKPEAEPAGSSSAPRAGLTEVKARLVAIFTDRLGFAREEIAEDESFMAMGLSSITVVEFLEYVNQAFDLRLSTGLIFEHNTIHALAAHIAGCMPATERGDEMPVTATAKPLSEGEKGLWALARFTPLSGAYNCPLCLRCEGLDEELFIKACQALAQRFPILTSRFVLQNGDLQQRLDAACQVLVEKIDAVGVTEEALVTLLREKNSKPFDLLTGPLMRAAIADRGDGSHVVLFSVHHLAIDGGSVPSFLRTFIDAYRQLREGLALSRESAGITDYERFVEEERALLAGPEGARRVRYWRERLGGDLPTLNLPTDVVGEQQGGQTVSRGLPRALYDQVVALAREVGVYPSTVFLGVFKTVLRQYSGQRDVVVGMPVNERSENNADAVPGFFVNMVPVRSSFAPGTPMASFLRGLQATLLDDLAHRLPFPALVRELGLPLSSSAPLFRAAFEYQTVAIEDTLASLPDANRGPRFAAFDGVHQEGEYDVVFEVVAGGSGVVLRVKTAVACFSRGATERLLAHCIQCLETIIAHPEAGLDEVSLVTGEERRLLCSWNDTATPFDLETPVHTLFERQAVATPNAVALEAGSETITYAELDALSTQVAGYLRQQGFHDHDLIAICVRRSRWMVIGLLGILKAGAAYVPLDPTYPAERLRYMVEDAGARIVLTESSLVSQVEALGQALEVLPLDRRWEEIGATPKAGARDVSGDDLAYTIYTSGSSGQPKGVMIPHRALTNFLLSMAREPGFTAGDRILAVTTYGFDIAGLELFLPLIQGGVCCLCSSEEVADVELLKQAIARTRPTIMQATPSLWTMLARAGWRNQERVRIFCGGEPLPAALKTFFDDTGSEVWNLYGPTETTIWSTVQRLAAGAPITVGRPIANTAVWVLTERRQCAPLGVPGELCIAGAGLAHGYRYRPDLTAEVFVDHPMRPGEKLYRTGDLARWLPEGEIEHLGRLDFQVKINGFRIELGEIERRMVEHPAVQNCVVVAKELEGARQLVAYVVADRFDATALRTHLAERVAPYMVPSHILAIDRFPMTANGKMDRRALAARDIQIHRDREQKLPQSELERKLLAIWQDLLQIEKLSTTDGFFEVGGSSVLAVVLADRICHALGVAFTAPELFKYPSVQAIAAHLAGPSDHPAVEAVPAESQPGPAPGKMPAYYAESLAIVGISCQFADAEDHRAFWANLRAGKTSGRFLTPEELRAANVPEDKIADPRFVPFDGKLPGRDRFDPVFLTCPRATQNFSILSFASS